MKTIFRTTYFCPSIFLPFPTAHPLRLSAFTGSDYRTPFGEASCRIRGQFLSLEDRRKEIGEIFSSIWQRVRGSDYYFFI